jgi:hypothetical protein
MRGEICQNGSQVLMVASFHIYLFLAFLLFFILLFLIFFSFVVEKFTELHVNHLTHFDMLVSTVLLKSLSLIYLFFITINSVFVDSSSSSFDILSRITFV